MQFTPREVKMIERLPQPEHHWRWERWMLLGVAAFAIAVYSYLAYVATLGFHVLGPETFSPADLAIYLFALFWPKVLFLSGLTGGFVGLAVRDWHGNAIRTLLLRLLDAQQEQERQT